MGAMPLTGTANDDPLRLRELLSRAERLASGHSVGCVMVGLAAPEGDLFFPEIVDYVESALRIDDSIFRMTRERIVLMLADVDRAGAEEITARLLAGFRERFSTVLEPRVSLAYYEVPPGTTHLTVKQVLPVLFNA